MERWMTGPARAGIRGWGPGSRSQALWRVLITIQEKVEAPKQGRRGRQRRPDEFGWKRTGSLGVTKLNGNANRAWPCARGRKRTVRAGHPGALCAARSQAGTSRAAPEVGNPNRGESNLSFTTPRKPLCFWKFSRLFGVTFWDLSIMARWKMISLETSSLMTSAAETAAEQILLQQQK